MFTMLVAFDNLFKAFELKTIMFKILKSKMILFLNTFKSNCQNYCTYMRINFFRYAGQVLINDEVLVQENDYLTPAKVKSVSFIELQGNYISY